MWLAIKEVPIQPQSDIATQLSDGLKKRNQCWGVAEKWDHSLRLREWRRLGILDSEAASHTGARGGHTPAESRELTSEQRTCAHTDLYTDSHSTFITNGPKQDQRGAG